MDVPTHLHGRGTALNPANRFELVHVAAEGDYFDPSEPPPPTELYWDDSKSIISWNNSPDLPFDAAVNPYRGCEHGCIYCYARPYHEYLGLSAGIDFETKIIVKKNAADLLRAEFMKKSWEPRMISMSGVTDCYQPLEARLGVTRALLEVFAEFRNPVGIITKNALITRDIALLKTLAAYDAVGVTVSITTLDEDLRRVLEPRTSTIEKRFQAIQRLADAGVPVGVNVAPIIPGLTDEDMVGIMQRARECGAGWANPSLLRLPYAVADLFAAWLEQHVPGRKEKVLRRVRSMRGGRLNESRPGVRMTGEGEWSESLLQLFRLTRKRLGFETERKPLSTAAFQRPGQTRAMF